MPPPIETNNSARRHNRANRALPRIPHEDFFRLDDALDTVLGPGILRLAAPILSIFVRTVLTAEVRGKKMRCVLPAGTSLTESPYLQLCYSQFFAQSPLIEPPPGPRPSVIAPGAVLFERYGFLFHRNDRRAVAAVLSAGIHSVLQEAGLEVLTDGRPLVSGVQLVSSASGRRLLLVHEMESRGAEPPVVSKEPAAIGVDCFERFGQLARYRPQAGSEAGQRKVSFRRRERRNLSGRYVALSLPLSE